MKRTEVLFKAKTDTDSKSILNKLNKKVDKAILDQVEAGVTIETLDKLSLSGVPILKYHTQITIHGLFDELSNNYIFGYKNLFQNKNKSIGVKYNAIDEAKRQRIAKRLRCIGFSYTRNSQETGFHISEHIDKDNFDEVKKRFIELKGKVNESLFYGSVCIWVGESFGAKYLCFDLNINAIYERNIEPFLNGMGATTNLFNELQKKRDDEQAAYEFKLGVDKAERDEAREQALNDNKGDLSLLANFNRVQKVNDPGLYLLRMFNYNNELVYKVIYLYMPKGKKKPRCNKTEYININEALSHEPKESYSDSIYGGKVTGYKLK